MNPYKDITHLFQNAVIAKIEATSTKLADKFSLEAQPPHVFAVAALALKNLGTAMKKQAIVISGESGAGNTLPLLFSF